ncbi:nucleotidyl transferase AbiEii/AbiGii toxin family protein, partial [Patescibacteria group bacterium]|nr:nucleotidyl transferase AbiEii/AbiGii toxin family protein [Patescibacteria group bacterium]
MKNAYLAGGTALALQLGHRVSYDLDFFTNKKFKAQIFLNKISQFKSYKHERLDWGTILGKLGDVKFSLFYYSYPLLEKPFNYEGIGIAGTKDIAAMKLAAISERGAKRDFIDLYFILQTLSLIEVFNLYDKKYKKLSSNLIHIRKSLTYFADADKDNMPDMIKRVSWKEITPRILGRAGIFESFILVFQENQKRTGFLKEGE